MSGMTHDGQAKEGAARGWRRTCVARSRLSLLSSRSDRRFRALPADRNAEWRPRDRIGDDATLQIEHCSNQILREDLGGAPRREDASVPQCNELVGITRRLVEIVQHHQDRSTMSA